MTLAGLDDLLLLPIVLFGLIFGSFLNVVAHRVPLMESVVFPGSHCPGCGASVRWYQNLPVLSYLVLRGRCATCGMVIPLRYLLVELSTPAVLTLVYVRFGASLPFVVFAPFALAMVVLFVIDLEHQLLPDVITKPGIFLGLVVSPWNPRTTALEALGGAALGYGSLWLLARVYKWSRGVAGMGGGDLKLAAMIGAFGGPRALLAVVLLASIGGLAVALVLIVLRRADMHTALPFGCFLAPAAFLVVLVGADLLWDGWQSFVLHYVYGIETGG